ncbi:UNVERIFIED_CONTAM: hypothetical protein NCL1_49483 [Trichonephila clavipes]
MSFILHSNQRETLADDDSEVAKVLSQNANEKLNYKNVSTQSERLSQTAFTTLHGSPLLLSSESSSKSKSLSNLFDFEQHEESDFPFCPLARSQQRLFKFLKASQQLPSSVRSGSRTPGCLVDILGIDVLRITG